MTTEIQFLNNKYANLKDKCFLYFCLNLW